MAKDTSTHIPTIEEMDAAIAASRAQIESDETLHRELTEGRPSGNPITLGPRLPDAKTWASDQIDGAKAKASKWLRNTTHPTKNFKEEALKPEAQKRYKDSMTRVLEQNLHAGGMALVDESETMAIISARGEGVYSKGIEDRRAKIERRVDELHADRLALVHTVDGMPIATDEQREAKMVANVRGLKAIGARRRGAKAK
jgi:hypothetical protein